jgi:hypothetical protein
MTKHSKPTLKKLEELFNEISYTVRYEKGNFNSGYCILDDRKVIVVNRFFDTDTRVNVLIDLLTVIPMDESLLSEKSRLTYRNFLKTAISAIEQN